MGEYNRKTKFSFIAATFLMTVLCIASSASSPFFATYQALYNISDSIISMSTVVYFVGNVFALIFLSRLSNHLGRKTVMYGITALAIIACLNFVFINNDMFLLIGRFLQGLCWGISAGSTLVYIVETAPKNSNLGIIVSSNISLIGFSIGALISGHIVDFVPSMIKTIFIVIIGLFIISFILMYFSEETVKPQKGVISSLKPKMKVPNNIKRFMPLIFLLFISTYALISFYQTFSSLFVMSQFGSSSKFLAAIIYASLMAPLVIGSVFIGRISDRKALDYGLIGFTIFVIFINISLIKSQLILFIISCIIASMFFGSSFTSSIKNVVDRTKKEDLGEVMATIYVMTDGSTALMSLIITGILNYTNLINLSLGYLVFLIILCIVIVKYNNKISYEYDY